MCLPAIILGRNPLGFIAIYAEQTDCGMLIQMNCPNIFVFICDGNDMNNYFLFKTLSIFLKDVVTNGKKLEDKKTEIVTV